MKTTITSFPRFALLILVLALPPRDGAAQEYDSTPLITPATLPTDGLPATPLAFTDWLEANAATVPPARQAVVREHLYALISADIKARFVAGFPVFPAERDSVLADLFLWGDRLGVFGAYRVARVLDPARSPAPPVNPIPPIFEVSLDSGYFTVRSSQQSWSIRFPFYFMLSAATHQRMGTGFEGDVLVLSTLFAPNDPRIGSASQATILVTATKTEDSLAAVDYWLKALGVNPKPEPDSLFPGGTTYRGFDPAMQMRKEAVVIPMEGGIMVVSYLGLEGTFQANHPHFVNFLEHLRTSP